MQSRIAAATRELHQQLEASVVEISSLATLLGATQAQHDAELAAAEARAAERIRMLEVRPALCLHVQLARCAATPCHLESTHALKSTVGQHLPQLGCLSLLVVNCALAVQEELQSATSGREASAAQLASQLAASRLAEQQARSAGTLCA